MNNIEKENIHPNVIIRKKIQVRNYNKNKYIATRIIGKDLILPNEHNYNEIVSFIKDLKYSITYKPIANHKNNLSQPHTSRNEIERVITSMRCTPFNNENNRSEVLSSRIRNHKRIKLNCRMNSKLYIDRTREKLHINKSESILIEPSFKHWSIDQKLKFALRDPFEL